MYHATFYSGMRDSSSREGGNGFAPRGNSFALGGSSPLVGDLGQPYQQGGLYSGPPGGPPEEGQGPLGSGNLNAYHGPQAIPQQMPVNGSLKGTAPVIFNSTRKNIKQFI